jgi:hypothetical protein
MGVILYNRPRLSSVNSSSYHLSLTEKYELLATCPIVEDDSIRGYYIVWPIIFCLYANVLEEHTLSTYT